MKKLTFVVGAAAGYVLGTRAGRDKYQQIVEGARNLGQQPTVQQAQSKIKDLVNQGTHAMSTKFGTGTTDVPTSDTGTTYAQRPTTTKVMPVTTTVTDSSF